MIQGLGVSVSVRFNSPKFLFWFSCQCQLSSWSKRCRAFTAGSVSGFIPCNSKFEFGVSVSVSGLIPGNLIWQLCAEHDTFLQRGRANKFSGNCWVDLCVNSAALILSESCGTPWLESAKVHLKLAKIARIVCNNAETPGEKRHMNINFLLWLTSRWPWDKRLVVPGLTGPKSLCVRLETQEI